MALECNLPLKLNKNKTWFETDFVNCVMKSRIRRFYARFCFFILVYALIKVMVEFFLYKILVSHDHNPYSWGVGDYTQKDTRSLGQSLQFCQLISVLFVSHKYLVSELNWKLKLPKTYFMFLLYLICQETQSGDSRTFSRQNESTFKKKL